MPKAVVENLSLSSIGIFPEYWEALRLTDVCKQVTDGTHDSPKSTKNGFPLVTGKSIKRRRIDFAIPYNISAEDHAKVISRSKPERDDILFTNIGNSIGDLVRVNTDLEFSIKNVALFKPDTNVIIPRFLEYYLFSSMVQSFIQNSTKGSAQPFMGLSSLRGFPIAVPPLSEQKSIAHILGSLDDKIELNRQMNETLESMAQALFKSWFVEFDPVIDNALAAGNPIPDVFAERAEQRKKAKSGRVSFNGSENSHQSLFPSEFEFSEEMGWIPKGWKPMTLNETTSEIIDHRGKTPKKLGGDWSECGYPAISAKNIKGNKLVRSDTIRYVDKGLYQKWMKIPLEKGDVVMTSEAPLGELYYLNSKTDYLLSQRLYGIRADRVNCTGAYLFNWLQTEIGSADLQNRATGTTVVGIKQSELRKIIILCPSGEVLESYDLFACGYLEKMDANDVSNMDLAKLRDTLLPKLLSGELRIPDAEKLIKEAGV